MAIERGAYWCFLSYRHADNKAQGRQWATWLHQQIETYEVPSDLVGTTNERGDELPERIFPVFRDEEELPADADLESPIYRALDASKFLVVLCSPRAVASSYVASEILYFKRAGKSDRVLAALLEGEPNASRDPAKNVAGIRAEDECFPVPLRHPVDAEGRLVEAELAEPVAADFRLPDGRQGWTSPEAYRQALVEEALTTGETPAKTDLAHRVDAYRRQCELAKLKILAGILGVPLGTLTQRDKAYQLERARRRGRVFRRVAVALGLLALAAVVGGVFALLQKQEADAQRGIAEARRAHAESLLWEASAASWNEAEVAFEAGKPRDAVAHLARGMRSAPGNAGLLTFATALVARPTLPHRTLVFDLPVGGVAFDETGTKLVVAERRYSTVVRFSLWDLHTLERLDVFDGADEALRGEDLDAHPWLSTRPAIARSSYGSGGILAVASPDGTRVFHASNEGMRLVDASDPEKAERPFDTVPGLPEKFEPFDRASFSPDGLTLFGASWERVVAHHLPSAQSWVLPESAWCTGIAWSEDGAWAATAHSHLETGMEEGRGKVLVWNLRHGAGVAFLPRETLAQEDPRVRDLFRRGEDGAFGIEFGEERVVVRRASDGVTLVDLPRGEGADTLLMARLFGERERLVSLRGPLRRRDGLESHADPYRITLHDLSSGRVAGEAHAMLPGHDPSSASPIAVLHPQDDAVAFLVDDRLLGWAGMGTQPQIRSSAVFPDTVGWLGDLAFLPDGSALAVGTNRQLTLRSWPDLELLAGPAYHDSIVNTIAVSADGRWLASASGFTDGGGSQGYATLRTLPGLEPVGREFSHLAQVTDVVFARDGEVLITLSDDPGGSDARLWQTATSLPLTHFIGGLSGAGQFLFGTRADLRPGLAPDVVVLEVTAEQDAFGPGTYAAFLPLTTAPVPDWFSQALLPLLTAREVSSDGLLRDVAATRLSALRETVRAAIEGAEEEEGAGRGEQGGEERDVYRRIAAWALADPADRDVAPLCGERLAEHLEKQVFPLLEAGSFPGMVLGHAHQADPTHPDVLLRLAAQEANGVRRAFLEKRAAWLRARAAGHKR